MNIALPTTSRRAVLRSFWFVISFLSGLAVMIVAVCLGRLWLITAGAMLAVLLAALVFVRERFVWRLYGAWNHRLAQPLSALSRRLVLKMCYFVIFRAVGRKGSRLPLTEREGVSAWVSRSSLPPEAYTATFAGADGGGGGWVRQYLRWAFHSGNAWAAALLPSIILLRLFSGQEEKPVEANIYTLF
jgi:hypothetical protein